MNVITVEQQPKTSLMPEAIVNLYQALNAGTRMVRRIAEGGERLVNGIDEISSILIEQQKAKLISELTVRQQLT